MPPEPGDDCEGDWDGVDDEAGALASPPPRCAASSARIDALVWSSLLSIASSFEI